MLKAGFISFWNFSYSKTKSLFDLPFWYLPLIKTRKDESWMHVNKINSIAFECNILKDKCNVSFIKIYYFEDHLIKNLI